MKIGIFDSGLGGTTVMNAIKSLLPAAEYSYIADSEHCPYGEKSDAELYKIVRHNVDALQSWGAKIIVIACNTATTRCIAGLRRDYPNLQFVGTEPAIKLAAETNATSILVLATPGTIHSERLADLLRAHQNPAQSVTLLSCPGLADAIEHNLQHNPAAIHVKLTELFSPLSVTPDCIVLGCTHYSLIKDDIQKFFPTATLLDGNAGVARRVEFLAHSLAKQ